MNSIRGNDALSAGENHSVPFPEAYHWLLQSERRKRIIREVTQPLTATHLSRRTGMLRHTCTKLLLELAVYELVYCLNEHTHRSRVYWLTYLGLASQLKLCELLSVAPPTHDFPKIDWHLYGWVCFGHRTAIINALVHPMRPPAIKRRARLHDDALRMSADNVRDVILLFLAKGIVRPVYVRKKGYPAYELTDVGVALRRLLRQANSPA